MANENIEVIREQNEQKVEFSTQLFGFSKNEVELYISELQSSLINAKNSFEKKLVELQDANALLYRENEKLRIESEKIEKKMKTLRDEMQQNAEKEEHIKEIAEENAELKKKSILFEQMQQEYNAIKQENMQLNESYKLYADKSEEQSEKIKKLTAQKQQAEIKLLECQNANSAEIMELKAKLAAERQHTKLTCELLCENLEDCIKTLKGV